VTRLHGLLSRFPALPASHRVSSGSQPGIANEPPAKNDLPTFRDSVKSAQIEPGGFTPGQEMSRLAFALFIATGLFFTAYFGAAAWRLSDDGHMDVTGQIRTTGK
jgi:hypothetical protein